MNNSIENALILMIGIAVLLFAIKYLLSNFGKEGKKLGVEILKIGITSEIVVFLFLISTTYSSLVTILFVIIGIFIHNKKKNRSKNSNNQNNNGGNNSNSP